EYQIRGDINWKNNWWTKSGIGTNTQTHSNSFLRGGPRWRSADNAYLYFFFGSNRSKKFSFKLGYFGVRSDAGIYTKNRYVFSINYQPLDAFSLSLENEFNETKDKTQYVSTADFGNIKRYILGAITNDSWATTLRLNYSLNPNFSFQFYGQSFISRGRYADFNFVNNASASSFNERVNQYTVNQLSNGTDFEGNATFLVDENSDNTTDYSFEKPDFSFVQLQTNLVVRWEYVPGSELFLVWSRGSAGSQNANNSLTDSVRNQVLDVPAKDTFLLKATYRFIR
ncbi:DUF5916 domain-containing protein, partial [Polaribacter sp.]|nr:DUF5916 domain-containing protein [Polaribacter sp.]